MKVNFKKQKKYDTKDWNFDFSDYEQEGQEEENAEGHIEKPRPRISSYKSRFSNGQALLEQLAELGKLISTHCIEVEARTQDMPTLWKTRALLNEFWALIKDLHGQITYDMIHQYQNEITKMLEEQQQRGGRVSNRIHIKLLEYRDYLYSCRYHKNLGFETEKSSRGGYAVMKDKIVQ